MLESLSDPAFLPEHPDRDMAARQMIMDVARKVMRCHAVTGAPYARLQSEAVWFFLQAEFIVGIDGRDLEFSTAVDLVGNLLLFLR